MARIVRQFSDERPNIAINMGISVMQMTYGQYCVLAARFAA